MGAIQCDFCHEEPGLLLMTNQETGDTQSIGSSCLPAFLKEMSTTWGVWPKIEDVLTDELVQAEAVKRGMMPAPAGDQAPAKPKRGGGRKPANAGAQTLAESAAQTRAGHQPTDYSEVPDALLTEEERKARAAEAHRQMQEATGGQ